MHDDETARLNSRRIEAANALYDANARLRALIANDVDFWNGNGGRRAEDGEIARAQRDRDSAQTALDEAELELSAHSTAERIAHEAR